LILLPHLAAEKLQNFFGVFLQFHIGVDSETDGYVWAKKKPPFLCRKDGLCSRAICDFRMAIQG